MSDLETPSDTESPPSREMRPNIKVIPVYEDLPVEGEVFRSPDDLDVPIWRYMDFTKFVSMLVNRGLYFSRVDRLGDPFEGSIPRRHVEDCEKLLSWEIRQDPKLASQMVDSFRQIREHIKKMRKFVYVSSWHISETESAAMWRLYSRTEEAVCIRSSFRKLRNALKDEVKIGMLQYVDYEEAIFGIGGLWSAFLHKRKSFEHERELRALVDELSSYFSGGDSDLQSDGLWRGADLEGFVEAVYIAPTAPNWFAEVLRATISRFGFGFEVRRSSLDADPLW